MNDEQLSDWEMAGRAARGKAERFIQKLKEARAAEAAANDPAGPEATEAA